MNKIKKWCLGWAIIVASACSPGTNQQQAAKPSEQPNVIVIMADDLGYSDLGCYSDLSNVDATISTNTPNLDSLARGGMMFTDYHSNGVVCSPTRASLLTGLYPQEAGVEGVVTAKSHRDTGLSPEKYTMAEFFLDQGYSTAIFGKWHLGYSPEFGPNVQGFNHFTGFVSGNIDYISHIDQEGYADWWRDKNLQEEEGYLTEMITTQSIEFMDSVKDKPFFLYIAHGAPHYPYQGPNDPADRTVNGDFPVLGSRQDVENAYAEMISSLDESVGRTMKYLQENDLLENTLVVFCSDNGAAPKVGSNAPWRGHKGQVYEGGHRVPAIFYWKDKISSGNSSQLAMSMDLFPTLVELLNLSSAPDTRFSGQSLAGTLTEDNLKSGQQERVVFWRFKDQKAARKGPWKVVQIDGQNALYNLEADPKETTDVSEMHPEILQELLKALGDWESELNEPIQA